MDKFITDHILNHRKLDIIKCIEKQEYQNKESFDELFKETLVDLYFNNKHENKIVFTWIQKQIMSDFEILDRSYVWKYWIDIEFERLNNMVEHSVILKAQKIAKK